MSRSHLNKIMCCIQINGSGQFVLMEQIILNVCIKLFFYKLFVVEQLFTWIIIDNQTIRDTFHIKASVF